MHKAQVSQAQCRAQPGCGETSVHLAEAHVHSATGGNVPETCGFPPSRDNETPWATSTIKSRRTSVVDVRGKFRLSLACLDCQTHATEGAGVFPSGGNLAYGKN